MGTFGHYTGNMNIPEDKKEKFTSQVSKILNYGGMMQLEGVEMFEHKIVLMKPVEIGPEDTVRFHYNYFEDEAWETVEYSAYNTDFYARKIGSQEFNQVVTAVHFLYEMYDDNCGFAEVNGEIINAKGYVAWLNHILKENFSMKKCFRLWDNAQMLAFMRMDYEDIFSRGLLLDIIPEGLNFAAGGTELTDLLYIIYGTESLDMDIVEPGTYPDDVYQCKKALIHFFEKHPEEGAEELILPARVIVYLTSEVKKLDFWHIWRELEPSVYHDEQMKKYISEQLEIFRRETIEKPIPEISTCDFLLQDHPLTFHGTPEKLEGKPNYYITDDDRLYWWDGTDEVKISDSMDAWLKELAERHKRILGNLEEDTDKIPNFIEELIILMEDTEKYYRRIFLFQKMFYEFIHHSSRKEYRAAIELLRQMVEENKEDGKIIKKMSFSWDITSRNVTHNIARLKLKRYLSVLANKKLRKQYFEF